ncbi:UDP-N-acetylglucosamine 2-epimerase [Maridesulfovibrio sp. FT414]|uniref:UDP-N-acetylglucosamine 2-epimerase n=1 Tax=Maridesulfovibrio sp. FT414 TaxID=2979469 RepID=UPI003D805BFC
MNKRKICVVLTTRGNYAKMKSVMHGIVESDSLELQLIIAGGIVLPKYGHNIANLISSEFKVDRHIHYLVEGDTPMTMAKSAGLAITEFSTAFENLCPDAVVVIADRFECLSIAMASSYMNIPVIHLEGGEVSGSIDESVRHAITKLSHIHFPATEDAAQRIIKMGEEKETVFTVGGTSLDVIRNIDTSRSKLKEFNDIGVGAEINLSGDYFVVIQHPVTTEYSKNMEHLTETAKAITDLGMPTAWIWPNMDAGSDEISKGIRTFREKCNPVNVRFFKGLPIQLYAPLLANASCIIGNSSSGLRESAFLGTPCVNIGTRQAGRERGQNVLDCGYSCSEIIEKAKQQLAHGRYEPDHLYGDGYAGEKIVNILENFSFNIQKQITY